MVNFFLDNDLGENFALRWRWFGDSNNQVAPTIDFNQDAYQYLRSFSYSSKLKYNVRNTPTIINKVQQWTLADMGSVEKYTGISSFAYLASEFRYKTYVKENGYKFDLFNMRNINPK